MNNRAELIFNIAKRAPWLIDDSDAFFPEKVGEKVELVLKNIGNSPLTILCDNGLVYRENLSIRIENNEIKIDKPSDWESISDTFHVFFQCKDENWYFFLVENAICYPMTYSAKTPNTIYSLQRRHHPRVMTSGNMGVIFRNDTNILATAHIRNVSVGGMLFSESSRSERYSLDSVISDIFISGNAHNEKEKPHSSRNIWPLINTGQIVRTSFDKKSSLAYYGVKFLHESSYVKETLSLLIDGYSC